MFSPVEQLAQHWQNYPRAGLKKELSIIRKERLIHWAERGKKSPLNVKSYVVRRFNAKNAYTHIQM